VRQGHNKNAMNKNKSPDRNARSGPRDPSDTGAAPGFLFERMSPSDPNTKLTKDFYCKLLIRSADQMAKYCAGKLSFEELVDGFAASFEKECRYLPKLDVPGLLSERHAAFVRIADEFIATIEPKLMAIAVSLGDEEAVHAVRNFPRKIKRSAAQAQARLLRSDNRRKSSPALLKAIIEKRKADPKNVSNNYTIREWAIENGFAHALVYDWLRLTECGQQLAGRVSKEKADAILQAIHKDAELEKIPIPRRATKDQKTS
jgi:hypothetical protein